MADDGKGFDERQGPNDEKSVNKEGDTRYMKAIEVRQY